MGHPSAPVGPSAWPAVPGAVVQHCNYSVVEIPSRLPQVFRYKVNQLYCLSLCLSSLGGQPCRFHGWKCLLKPDLREAGLVHRLGVSLCRPDCSHRELCILRRAKVSYLFTCCLLAVCALEHSVGRLGEESIWVCAPGDRDDVRICCWFY